jgi:hypothetical protein
MRQGNLSADETKASIKVGGGTRRIDPEFLPSLATDHPVDRLLSDSTKQIPQGEVHGAQGGKSKTLAAIDRARAVHLIPDAIDVIGLRTDDKATKMPFYEVAGRVTTGSGGKTDFAGVGFDLYQDASQHAHTPAVAGVTIFGVDRHRRCH